MQGEFGFVEVELKHCQEFIETTDSLCTPKRLCCGLGPAHLSGYISVAEERHVAIPIRPFLAKRWYLVDGSPIQ